jgi:hypothetical protein
MNQSRLTSALAALAAGLLLFVVTPAGPSRAVTSTRPATAAGATNPCPLSANRMDTYVRDGVLLVYCVHEAAEVRQPPCPLVADRIERRITLGLSLPSCVRRLQRAAGGV